MATSAVALRKCDLGSSVQSHSALRVPQSLQADTTCGRDHGGPGDQGRLRRAGRCVYTGCPTDIGQRSLIRRVASAVAVAVAV